jgi:hypothetical protein
MKTAAVKLFASLSLRYLIAVPVLAFLGNAAYGQGTASIVGTVTDPSGAVVPNAKITITNLDNGFVRTTRIGNRPCSSGIRSLGLET